MIFIIDIIILVFIAYFSITKSIRSNTIDEIVKLVSMALAILGSVFLYPELLQGIVFNLFSILFGINESQVDINFFNMLAFLFQFFILYVFGQSILNYFKNFLPSKGEKISGKISTIFPSLIRAILIAIIIIYLIDSLPNYTNQGQSNLKKSATYKTLSKISHVIIK